MGTSDIGKIIEPQDYDKTDIDDYIFHEDNEKIFFLIKAKTDEYCFTNTAFIHLDGTSAVSKKRTLNRYPYKHYQISRVLLETAGTIDRDVEIKFQLGGTAYSIDIEKSQIDKVRDVYKALFGIGEACKEIERQSAALMQTQQAVNNIETKVFSLEEKEIPSSVVGELVMDELKDLDEVAYVRFASVYREFKDVNTFMDELKKILDKEEK